MLKKLFRPDLVYYSPGDLYQSAAGRGQTLYFQISENVELKLYENIMCIDPETKNCAFEGNYNCLYNTDK